MKTEDYAALVALDWGEKQHAFARQIGPEAAIETGQLSASPESLHGWLEELGQRCGGRPVALAIEAGRNAVLYGLLEHPWLEIYQVHPVTSARFRRAFTPSGAKDDVPDCRVLLTLLSRHRDRLGRLVLDTAPTRELAALVLARRQAVDQRKDVGNQLRSVLKSYYPQALDLVGEDWCSPLALDLFERWPELNELKKARLATLRSFYARHNVRQAAVIEARVQGIATARALTTDRAVITPAMLRMRTLVELVRVLQKHVLALEARIAAAFATHPAAEFFRQLPGAGAVFAPRLLVAFGDDPSRYPNAASLQKFSGVAPVRQKSGQQVWTHWRWVNTKTYSGFEARAVKNEYDVSLSPDAETLDVEIAVMLKQQGKAFRIEKQVHSYPHCWSTDKPVLYYPLDAWFIRTTAFRERMIELNNTINWKPQSTGTGRFGKWLENLVDWNLSRSRYWGTPLPIWVTEDRKEEKCIGSASELKGRN